MTGKLLEPVPGGVGRTKGARLFLPDVTLCAVTSVNVDATIRALSASLDQIDFGASLLFTDAPTALIDDRIHRIAIDRISSTAAYSHFILTALADFIATSHCLVVQWDGYVLDANRWRGAFLDYDYIGASWPQFRDGHNVGNGGFSLRSRRLMLACRAPAFRAVHPEDVAIGRVNRTWLEQRGMTFAPQALADLFATERSGNLAESFGFHGVFNMPRAIGIEAFWQVYRSLDCRGTARHDIGTLIYQIARGPGGLGRAARMIFDRLWLDDRRRAPPVTASRSRLL